MTQNDLQLDRQARLLLYLAGELPAGPTADLEREMAGDASLERELEELRRVHDRVLAQLGAADPVWAGNGRGQPAAIDESRTRRVMRGVREQALCQSAGNRIGERMPLRPRAVLGYGMFAAAAAAVLVVGLWGVGLINLPEPGLAAVPPGETLTEDPGASLAMTLKDDLETPVMPTPDLDEAAEQLRALQAEANDDQLLLML